MRRPVRRGRGRGSIGSAGFTLVEMIAILAILAGAAAIVGIVARPLRERSVVARSARMLGALIVRAEALAAREGRPSRIRQDAGTGAVEITGTPYRVRLDPALTLSLTPLLASAGADEDALVFMPDGTGTGGQLGLAIAGSGAPGRTLRVSWLTGAITDAP